MSEQHFQSSAGTALLSQLPKPRAPRYQTLDHWRGLACLMIVLFHASIYVVPSHDISAPHDVVALQSRASSFTLGAIHCLGWGVPIFLVISGPCIAATVDSSC